MKLIVDTDELLKKLNDSIGATMGEQIPRWLWEGVVAEFKNERSQGEWNYIQSGMCICPFCGAMPHKLYKNFCAKCGAKMQKDE